MVDLCVPGSDNSPANDPVKAVALAQEDTWLAVHNARNYAEFAFSVGIAHYNEMPPGPPEAADMTGETRKKVQSVSSVLESIDGYPTKTRTFDERAWATLKAPVVTCA